MKAKEAVIYFNNQKGVHGSISDAALMRIFDPYSVNEMFVINISGEKLDAIVRKGKGGYERSEISLIELEKNPNLQLDIFFKPKKTSDIYSMSSISFEEGGSVEMPKTYSSKYWDYISIISGKIKIGRAHV